ncbi:MAG: DUF4159 domain-containing protein [Planctomycetes bacterium]|nr:DUF4159 domain-containing protein [Planctomycetota bacterium]
MSRSLVAFLAAALAIGLSGAVAGQEGGDYGPCGQGREGKPRRIKGGESFAPLPLPATPLRRTERKREPAPPTLIGKIVWGGNHTGRTRDGEEYRFADWNLDPSDVQRLLKAANRELGIRFTDTRIDLRSFSYDPAEVPILYLSGTRAPSFDAETLRRLRGYVEAGGSLWADACHGSKEFAGAFRAMMAAAFPDRPLAPLAPDHALFRAARTITRVRYSAAVTDRPDGAPWLEGIYIGCRTAVLLTPYDLSCAWDSLHEPEGASCVVGRDAFDLGVNMVAYALAYHDLGRYLAEKRTLETQDPSLTGDFTFAQIRFDGLWDPDPSAFANLLEAVLAETSTRVCLGRTAVRLAGDDLSVHPFLYMTGHGDFRLSDDEVRGLAAYLESGGTLLADACCGDLVFDAAFRRELARALPGRKLETLPGDHPVLSAHHRIAAIEYTPQAKATFEGLATPAIEGIDFEGRTRVFYSRFDLGCGWEGQPHPFARGVSGEDALRLGTNIVVYALTH